MILREKIRILATQANNVSKKDILLKLEGKKQELQNVATTIILTKNRNDLSWKKSPTNQ